MSSSNIVNVEASAAATVVSYMNAIETCCAFYGHCGDKDSRLNGVKHAAY
jgi:hypothetical protein